MTGEGKEQETKAHSGDKKIWLFFFFLRTDKLEAILNMQSWYSYNYMNNYNHYINYFIYYLLINYINYYIIITLFHLVY